MRFVWLLLLSFSAQAATLSIPDFGERVDIFLPGDNTNLTFIAGLGTNNSVVSTTKLVLTVTSPGYDSTGTSNGVTRYVYGTKQRRMSYPFQGTNEVYQIDATTVLDRVSISDYIFSADTLTATALDGFASFTNAATNAVGFSGVTVTNGSAIDYATFSEPSVNWAHPGHIRWTNATEYVWLKGGHWSGIAAIKVIAKDQNTNSFTNFATRVKMALPPSYTVARDYWVAPITTTGFTNYDRIRVDFIAYPRIGNAVFDTTLDRWGGIMPLPCSQTNFLDRSNILSGVAVVQVGATAGTDGIITNVAPELVEAGMYFSSVKAAFNRIAQTNWLRAGIAEPIGTVYVRANVSNYTGSSLSPSNTARSWAIIRNYPGENPVLTNYTDQSIGHALMLWGDTSGGGSLRTAYMNVAGAAAPFRNMARLWMANVDIAGDTTQMWFNDSQSNCTYLTDCRFLTRLGQGIKATTTQNTSFALLRDIDVGGINVQCCFYTAIGISKRNTTNSGFQWSNTTNPHSTPVPAHSILTDSEFLGNTITSSAIELNGNAAQRHGMWIENVVLEGLIVNGAALTLCANAFHSTTNVVLKNVTIVGSRSQMFYALSNTVYRPLCRNLNTIYQVPGSANDATINEWNAAFTNNQNIIYSVGFHGNVFLMTTNFATHWYPEFPGMNSFYPSLTGASGFQSFQQTPTNFVQWVDLEAYYGSGGPSPMVGLGTYRLLSVNDKFFKNVKPVNLGGRDVHGLPYSDVAPPGYSAAGDVKKGAFF